MTAAARSGETPEERRERERLVAVAASGLMGAPRRPALDAVAALAAHLGGTGVGFVSLVDDARHWNAGAAGADLPSLTLEQSVCALALTAAPRATVVRDASTDPRLRDHPSVVDDPHVRTYLGVPLAGDDGHALGMVCAVDDRPALDSDDELAVRVEMLGRLAAVASELVESARTTCRLEHALFSAEAARSTARSARRYVHSIFQASPMPMAITDSEARYLQVNASLAELLEIPADELVGQRVADRVPPHQWAQELRIGRELLAGDGAGTRLRTLDIVRGPGGGDLVPVLARTSRVDLGEDGVVLLTFLESVEERRAAEARLLEVQSVHDGVVSLDASGLVTAWNLGAERVLGHAAADRVGRRLDAVVPPEHLAAHDAGLQRLHDGGTPRMLDSTVEVPALHADGRRLLLELSLSRWAQGTETGYTAVLRDITARRRTELLTGLVHFAAEHANAASSFGAAAHEVLSEVLTRLSWVAGQAWTSDGVEDALWVVSPHVEHAPDTQHAPDGTCALLAHAAEGRAPDTARLPGDAGTVVGTAEDLRGTQVADAVDRCGLGGGASVPVLVGGDAVARLGFYFPSTADLPDAEVLAALEQVGTQLGRVVERERAVGLRQQVDHDPLTELPNRRLLLRAIETAQHRSSGRAAIVLLALDRFRLVNDSLGHAVGDVVLQTVASRLSAITTGGDLVARLGGDEFAVLVEDVRHRVDGAVGVGRDLLAAMCVPVDVGGLQLPVRASAGVCVLDEAHAAVAHYPAAVLRDADRALRRAKRRDVGQAVLFDEAMREDAAQQLADESELVEAITTGGLLLHYQPVVEMQSGRVSGFEALVRWQRGGQLVPPALFIPLAESSGLIVELGRWVLKQACRDAASWPETLPALATARVAVNVSARQLVHPRILEHVQEALAASGLPPHRLVVEITESALIEDRPAALDVLHALRAMGVRLALDDFGTGYSSLSYVQDLPVDLLKIDKSFVDPVTGPGVGTALAEVVLKLAEATGLETVAEGIESFEQAEALRRLGCRFGQGYSWSRPLPMSELPELADRLVALAATGGDGRGRATALAAAGAPPAQRSRSTAGG